MANPLAALQAYFQSNPQQSAGIASLPTTSAAPPPPADTGPDLPPIWQQFDVNTLPKNYVEDPESLRFPMYAAGTVPKNTDPKTGLETLPLRDKTKMMRSDTGENLGNPYLSGDQIYAIARGMGATRQHGVAQLPPEQLAGMILQEGRPDLGNNIGGKRAKKPEYYDPNSKAQAEMFDTLKSSGLHSHTASWLTKATAKQQLADRLKIPFGVAWNGTGTSNYQTGAQYGRELQANIRAAQHPKNTQLLDLVKQGYQDGLNNPVNVKKADLEQAQ